MKSLRRLLAVILKECTQIERDPSILLIGLFLPIFLLMLFGYGLSMDVKGVPVAIVAEDASPLSDRFKWTRSFTSRATSPGGFLRARPIWASRSTGSTPIRRR